MHYMQDPAVWGAVGGTCAAAVAAYAVRSQRVISTLRARNTALLENVRLRDEGLAYLVETLLPALAEDADALRDAVLTHESLAETPFAANIEAAVASFAGAAREARRHTEESTKTALKSAMRTLQGLAAEQQLAISQMQSRHSSPVMLQDLLEIDHMNAQFGRRAQVVAALCGGWTGRQRQSMPLYDVMRGAKGRIRDYLRVEVRVQSNVALVGRAVEPVALVVAELLDNATSCSPPHTTVEINFQRVPSGVCIMIDDAGVGMHEEERRSAARLLSGEPVGITGLGHPPRFGFAVVGMLAAQYGFSVSVDTTSPYGGVRAVVLLPTELLAATEPDAVPDDVSASDGREARPEPTREPAREAVREPQRAARASGGSSSASPFPALSELPEARAHELLGVEKFVSDPVRPPVPAQPTRARGRGAGEATARETVREPQTTEDTVDPADLGDLPQRRRRGPNSAVQAAAQHSAAEEVPSRSVADTASVMGAFHRGTRSGRSVAAPDVLADTDESKRQEER